MPGDIMRGYLQAEARSQQEEELAEQKKLRKLTESLNELKLKQLRRQMERAAEEWKYQQRVREEKEQAMLRLRESGVDIDRLLVGLEEPGLKIGTMPIAKGYGINPLTGEIQYTEPEKPGLERTKAPWYLGTEYEATFGKPTISEVTKGMETLYPRSGAYQQLGTPETPADSLWAGLITKPRTAEELPFFTGKERVAGLLTGLQRGTTATAQKKAQIDAGLDAGHTKAEIKAAIDAEKDRLVAEGVDVDELYRYLGF